MDLLTNESFVSITPKVVIDKFHSIRIHGNKAAHGEKSNNKVSSWLLKETWDIARWLFAVYCKGDIKGLEKFQAPEAGVDPATRLKQERKTLLQQHAKQEAQMQDLMEQLEEERHLRESAEKSVEELQATQSAGQNAAVELQFSESTTRKRLIDTQLASVGWDVDSNGANTEEVAQEWEVLHQPTPSGLGFADYVLWDDNGKPLAVIEAKKTALDAEQGRHQAKHYADGLEKMSGQRPVIFYTNGHDIWMWDDHPQQNYPPRKLYGFYSKQSLQYQVRQRTSRMSFGEVSVKPEILTDRIYQHEALKRICERFEEKHRHGLGFGFLRSGGFRQPDTLRASPRAHVRTDASLYLGKAFRFRRHPDHQGVSVGGEHRYEFAQ